MTTLTEMPRTKTGTSERRTPPRPALSLAVIQIASPCHADWSQMTGDERSRFCGECQKRVYNLSAMTAPEAEALLREKEGRLCVRYFQRADGTVMTQDCPVGLRAKIQRQLTAALARMVGLGVFGLALFGCKMRGSSVSQAGGGDELAVGSGVAVPVSPVSGISPAPMPVMGEMAPPPMMGKPAPMPMPPAAPVAPAPTAPIPQPREQVMGKVAVDRPAVAVPAPQAQPADEQQF